MKTDIKDRQDIEQLVNTFYDKVRLDDTIGHFFNEVAKVDWEHHLPKMYDFWENVLFYSGAYKGNPMQSHKELNEKSALQMSDFDQWASLFYATTDELFEGNNAEQIKQRALSIATVMKTKVVTRLF